MWFPCITYLRIARYLHMIDLMLLYSPDFKSLSRTSNLSSSWVNNSMSLFVLRIIVSADLIKRAHNFINSIVCIYLFVSFYEM